MADDLALSTPDALRPLRLDIVSDIVCPWCYIHYSRLESVRADWPDGALAIAWRPYQLDPNVPSEGYDREEYLDKKFGDPERRGQMAAALRKEGESAGIDFDWDRVRRYPNTFDAHRVLHWAATQDLAIQNDLAGRLFRLYFEEGGDLSDRTVLAEAAARSGLDRGVVASLLESGADTDLVRDEMGRIGKMGVTGVPFTLIEQRYGFAGAQSKEALDEAFRNVLSAREEIVGSA